MTKMTEEESTAVLAMATAVLTLTDAITQYDEGPDKLSYNNLREAMFVLNTRYNSIQYYGVKRLVQTTSTFECKSCRTISTSGTYGGLRQSRMCGKCGTEN